MTITTLYDDTFTYRISPHRIEARCHLQVIRGSVLSEHQTLVIVTELEDNPGMSVTNASEHIATKVVQQFKISPDNLTFLEHYNADSYHGKTPPREDEYSDVTYTWKGRDASYPQWKPLKGDALLNVFSLFQIPY